MPQRSLFLGFFSLSVLAGMGLEDLLNQTGKGILIGIAVCFFTFIDLFYWHNSYNVTVPYQNFFKPPQNAQNYLSANYSDRVMSIGEHLIRLDIYKDNGWLNDHAKKMLALRNLLDSNTTLMYGIPSYNIYSALTTDNYIDVIDGIIGKNSSLDNGTLIIPPVSQKWLAAENVRFIITAYPIRSNNFSLKSQTSDTFTYEIASVLPRVRAVKQVLSETLLDNPDLASVAYAENKEVFGEYDQNVSISNIVSPQNGNLKFKTSSQNTSFIVIADTYYPGWKATIDNSATKIYQVDIQNRGLIIPPGDHIVQMTYDPLLFKIGLFISFMTMLVVAGINAPFKLHG